MKVKPNQLQETILNLLWDAEDFDAALHSVVALVGESLSASCAYMFEYTDGGAPKGAYFWQAAPMPCSAQQLFSSCISALAPYCKTPFGSVDELPEEAAQLLRRVQAHSLLLFPIIDHGKIVAYWGVADSDSHREDWKQGQGIQEILASLSKIIGVFLLKTRNTQITEKNQQHLEAALQTSQQRADTAYDLLDSISAGVIIVRLYPDGSARPQYGNLGMYRMLRLPRTAQNAVVPDRNVAELESSYFDDFFANIPEPDNQRVRREYKIGFSSDHFTVKKYRLLRGDGTYLWVNADLSLRESTPQYRTYYATYTDMCEEQSLQSGLLGMLEHEKEITAKLEKASQAKSDFLSRMSHDIRTPMNAIMGMAAIAKAHINSPDRVADALEKIENSSKLLLSIINEVLDMSKIESGRIVLAEEEVSMAELINNVVTMVQPQIHEKSLAFGIHIYDMPHEVAIGDMQRLQQLLLNLLANAVNYTPEGGSILLELDEVPACGEGTAEYHFVVKDTGIGIRPEYMARIFEPFERAEDEKINRMQGTGLGLAICKSVAELMGGSIRVESEYGQGSAFTATVRLHTKSTDFNDDSLIGQLVLVVDDDEIVCQNACRQLASLGMKAEAVQHGAAAIEKIQAAHKAGNDYFAVLVDWMMPGMDGMEVTRRIRQTVGDSLPIIIISSYDLSEIIDDALEAGVSGFITKPLFRSRLVEKLRQCAPASVADNAAPLQRAGHSHAGKRILLVEDNALNREIASEILSESSIAVETAENGQIALDMVARSPEGYYDLIFMDMQMPVMDGCTATVAIRGLNRADSKTIPIVAMTANAFADDRQRTKDAGMNEHLAKPIDLRQLQDVLRRWL